MASSIISINEYWFPKSQLILMLLYHDNINKNYYISKYQIRLIVQAITPVQLLYLIMNHVKNGADAVRLQSVWTMGWVEEDIFSLDWWTTTTILLLRPVRTRKVREASKIYCRTPFQYLNQIRDEKKMNRVSFDIA